MKRLMRGRGVLRMLVFPLLAFVLPHGSSVASARGARALLPPHVLALARALAAHPLVGSALPPGFRNVGCGLRDHAIPCPVHISPKTDNWVVTYYMLLKRNPGPQNVYLNYRIYATRSVARKAFARRRHLPGTRNARPTDALNPY